ncbi:MAG TPA: EAL domain-containing protein [Conexibacter sp.]|nr:EAL domain-containing protein [Conexibacter sp.]
MARRTASVAADEVRQLGEWLKARTGDVAQDMVRRSSESGRVLDAIVEDSFERVGAVSTAAVARWMAGEGVDVARDVGQESWSIFGQLAAQRAAPLNEVTKRCLRWRDAAAHVIGEGAAGLQLSSAAVEEAQRMLQRSLDVTLVRMCESFEGERQRALEELTHRQEQLAFLATHDDLTGLPNRTLIRDRLEQMLVRGALSQTPVATLFIDIDNFKHVNDTLGHSVGDELLCAVAARLDSGVRGTDALGRLGGDEFVVIADGISLGAGPDLIAERLLEALREPFRLEGAEEMPVYVTASIGIASGVRTSADELLRHADIAMYRAKWDGKNRYVIFESGMESAVQSRMELEMDLKQALANEEFFLVYQPTFDLVEMVPSGMECLIRWRSPSRGTIQPDEFIPVLEETGMITSVGAWVLVEACRQGARWHAAGHPVSVAVNVSGRQLDDDEFLRHVEDALAASGFDPAALTIEITETTLMRNAEATAGRLLEVKRLGVRIAIDDFGTGYSSFAYLQQFPIDALKIDRSFISRVGEDRDGEILLRSLVQLGKALSIETLAEGIERPQELSLIRQEHCDSGQGFLFARPLDAGTVEAFLRNWDKTDLLTESTWDAPPVDAGALAARVPLNTDEPRVGA